DQAVGDIGGDLRGVALMRIAEAAATGQLETDRIARRHRLAPLRLDLSAGQQRDGSRRPLAAAVTAARRIVDALEIAQQADRVAVGAGDLDDLPEPAAKFTGTARP